MLNERVRRKTYIWWLAWRNLIARYRRNGLSFMTVISIIGVAIGVAALIIVLSVMGGFEADLKAKMLRGEPHLELLNKHSAVAGFPLTEAPLASIRTLLPEAVDIEPFTQGDVVLKQNRHITSAILCGVDPSRDAHLWGFGEAMTEGQLNGIGTLHAPSTNDGSERKYPGIVLGDKLSEQLGAELGDLLTVLSPQAGVTEALAGGTVSRQFVVTGKFRTDLGQYDTKWAVVSLAEGRKFMPDYDEGLDADEYVTGIAINLREPFDVDLVVGRAFGPVPPPAAAQLKAYDTLSPLTWRQTNKSLLFALKLEKFAMGSILMLIVVVAAFSISGTMMMTVFHRRGQVSLLRSLGMTRRDVAWLYVTHGCTIGTIGIGAGIVFGLAICGLITSFQFIRLPAGVYQLKLLPCRWLWGDYATIAVIAWLFAITASLYPALTAARQDPGEGLRYL